jgi:hypothetical protein
MTDRLDGCPEFDERLLESAFSAPVDHELDAHVAACARCRSARARYAETMEVLGESLSGDPETGEARRNPVLVPGSDSVRIPADARAPASIPIRSRRSGMKPRTRATLLATASLATLLLGIAILRSVDEPGFTVHTIQGVVSFPGGPGRIRLEEGAAEIRVETGPLVLETALGTARCDQGSFTASLSSGGGIEPMNVKHASLAVTIVVAAGVVWWTSGGAEIAIEPGSTWVERDASAVVDPGPDLVGAEPPWGKELGGARQVVPNEVDLVAPDSNATQASEAEVSSFEIVGRVVDGETGLAVPGARVTLGARSPDRRAFAATGTSDGNGVFRSRSVPWPVGAAVDPGTGASSLIAGTFFRVLAEGYAPIYQAPWTRFDVGSPLDATQAIDLGTSS